MNKQQSEPYLTTVFQQMNTIVADCMKRNQNCSCSASFKYDSNLPPNMQYKLSVFCDQQNTSKFVTDTDKVLNKYLNTVKPVQLGGK